jgi:hypothetical protein
VEEELLKRVPSPEKEVTPPPPAPQSEPVPLTTPEVFTWRHWVDPVTLFRVGAGKVTVPVNVGDAVNGITVPLPDVE